MWESGEQADGVRDELCLLRQHAIRLVFVGKGDLGLAVPEQSRFGVQRAGVVFLDRIECSGHPEEKECLNQAILRNRSKVLNADVEETICWGIDIYTRSNIYFSLPSTKDEPSESDR